MPLARLLLQTMTSGDRESLGGEPRCRIDFSNMDPEAQAAFFLFVLGLVLLPIGLLLLVVRWLFRGVRARPGQGAAKSDSQEPTMGARWGFARRSPSEPSR
jgi:hypothetical protein